MALVERIGPLAVKAGGVGYRDFKRTAIKDIKEFVGSQHLSPEHQIGEGGPPIAEGTGSSLARFFFGILFEECLYPKNKESKTFKGLCALMWNKYCHRIWIVQEIALSNQGIILCLGHAVPLADFIATYSSIWLIRKYEIHKLHDCTKKFGYRLAEFLYPRNVPLYVRTIYKSTRSLHLYDIIFQKKGPGPSMLNISDPRHLVFGLLDIISDRDELGLHAGYDKTVADVFTYTTKALLRSTKHAGGNFTLDCVVPVLEMPDDFPSWVPDWQRIASKGIFGYPINWLRQCHADRGMPEPENGGKMEEDLHCLEEFGCMVDM